MDLEFLLFHKRKSNQVPNISSLVDKVPAALAMYQPHMASCIQP